MTELKEFWLASRRLQFRKKMSQPNRSAELPTATGGAF
jgi:hypothetical protein